MPRLSPGFYTLRIEARSPIGRQVERREVSLVPGGRLLLTTDKPIYQPAQTIHVRALAMRSIDGQPLTSRAVIFTLRDPKGNKVFEQTRQSSSFGVAWIDFPLAEEVNLGRYTLGAVVEGEGVEAASTKRIKVLRYVLPKFKVTVGTDRSYYRPGQRLSGTVNARYFFGKPVRHGSVKLTVTSEQCGKLSGWRCTSLHHHLSARTDRRGRAGFSLKLQPCRLLAPCDNGVVRVRAVVTDSARQRREGAHLVPLTQLRLRLALAVAGGQLVPKLKNKVHLIAGSADGRAVSGARVRLRTARGVHRTRTDALGTATVEVIPKGDPRCRQEARLMRVKQAMELRAVVEDDMGHRRQIQRCVAIGTDALQVRPRYSLVGAAYPLLAEVRAPGAADGELAFLDVLKAGQTLVSLTSSFSGGVARFKVQPDAQIKGLVALRGYRVKGEGERISQLRAVYVEPRARLVLKAELDRTKEPYRPGGTATLKLQVRHSGNGEGIQAALGLHAVDAALLSLVQGVGREQDATLYFSLARYALSQSDKLTLKPGARGLGEWLARPAADRHRLRAAEVLLSAITPPAPSVWETDPWQQREQRWQEQAERLIEVAKESVERMALGQRTKQGWRFHPNLVGLLARAGRVPRRMVHDPWRRVVRPEQLQARDSSLCFATLARESAERKLERIYELLQTHAKRLRLPRERVPGASCVRAVVIPADIRARLKALPGVKGWELVDPWGHAFRRRRFRRLFLEPYDEPDGLSRYEIFSLGPDGRAGTLDDIVPTGRRIVGPLPRSYCDVGAGYGMLAGRRARAPRVICGRAMVRGSRVNSRPPSHGPVRVRSSFPETLFWQPELITDRQGRATVQIPLADSITTWKVLARASSRAGLFGQAKVDLRVFQPFFVDVDLPRELTEGDRISLPVTVYNYLKRPQRVTLKLSGGSWFTLLGSSTQTVSLGPSQVLVRHFPILARRIGRHQIEVVAHARSPSGQVVSDAVKRGTRVEPDGTEHALSRSGVLSGPRTKPKVVLAMTIPDRAIQGTSRVRLSIHPGPVSQTIEGLEAMLRMPHGCFEQTSSTLYPNVLVLDYLRRTKKGNKAIERKAMQYIDAGYQRLLTFEVTGGGFSWFGKRPANQVLTAYGLMEFHDIERVRKVDRRLIRRTQQWLVRRQRADGSWAPDKRYYLDGVVNNLTQDRLRITAYIGHALAHSGLKGAALDKAVAYVTRHLDQAKDPYTLALVANLLALRGSTVAKARRRALQQLWSHHRPNKDGILFPGPGSTLTYGAGRSGQLETTALAALAMLKSNSMLGQVPRLVSSLVAGKDRFGAWHSTQATILTLRALLAQQRKGSVPRGRLQVLVDGRRHRTVRLRGRDRAHHLDLTGLAGKGDHRVTLQLAGRGAVQYQLVGRYWLRHQRRVATGVKGKLAIRTTYNRRMVRVGQPLRLKVRVENLVQSHVPMPLVRVSLPPGFDLDPRQLTRVVRRAGVDRVQQEGNQALVYLSRLGPKKALSFTFSLRSKYPLQVQVRPSVVYEYYQPENRAVSQPQTIKVL